MHYLACTVRLPPCKFKAAEAAEADEVALLEQALKLAKERKAKAAEAVAAAPPSAADAYAGKAFTIKTFNAISPVGLKVRTIA